MSIQKRKKYKFLEKKLIRLRVNPLNNNKFLKLTVKMVPKKIRKQANNKFVKKTVLIPRFLEVGRLKKKKWSGFLLLLERANKFFKKFKPYTFNQQHSSKFASQGNSFKKKFRNDLLKKKTFDYFYGGLLKKYLKKQMTRIYLSKQPRNARNLSTEFFESRLDAVLFRAKFCSTIADAKQLISHNHVKVNRKVEKNNSYILKQGDLIQLDVKGKKIVKTKLKRQLKERLDAILWPMAPSYLNINYTTLEIVFDNITKFNFSSSFTFKNDNETLVMSQYRH